jgi:L-lactate dehydrogenase complex protein LldG
MLNSADQKSGAEMIDSFLNMVRQLRGVAYHVRSAREAVETLRGIVDSHEPKSVVVAGLPLSARMLAESALKGMHFRFVEQLKPAEALQVISKAEMSVTWAQYGLVEQGAIMEVSSDDAVKLSSSLPLVHIALLSSKDLLPDLTSAMRAVGKLMNSSESKPVVTLISGPSRTADIEMKLLYGVHGPNELHVMVLDWL